MKKGLQETLFEKYPKIFRQKDLPMQQTCMCWGICTGDGWYNIIDTLCHGIQHRIDWKIKTNSPIEQVEATQVKEKWGGLRFYYEGGDDYIEGLVSMAEALSMTSCINCGIPVEETTRSWNKICPSCEQMRHLSDIA
mgnify:CR=1 FL=1|tara:strand:- start:9895 stop:10305 length:411 start_codon:yes stop_codon:yes gene_type:complete